MKKSVFLLVVNHSMLIFIVFCSHDVYVPIYKTERLVVLNFLKQVSYLSTNNAQVTNKSMLTNKSQFTIKPLVKKKNANKPLL